MTRPEWNARHIHRMAQKIVVVVAVLIGVCAAGLLAGCSSNVRDTARREPTAVPAGTSAQRPTRPPATPTATPTPEQAVLDAYQRYWDAYSQAVLDLNPALVEGVAAGEELLGIREEIEDLRRRGLAIMVSVKHNAFVVEIKDDTAIVYDELTNNSFYVNAQSKEPRTASGDGTVLQDTYSLQKTDGGAWKVVSGGRQR